jgi:hypothetical protein
LLNGVPFVSGPWAPGSVLVIGDVAITVEPVDLRPSAKKRSPFWALTPLAVLAAAAIVFAVRASTAAEMYIPPAPALLDPPVKTCPNPKSPTLAVFAAERARVGYAKRERSPFSRADGIEAVGLLEVASACFGAAGRAEDEHETRAAAQSLRTKLDEEYRVRRVRAEHAVRVQDVVGAKRELGVLIPLTAHRHGPYVDWLASMDRYATRGIDERAPGRLR